MKDQRKSTRFPVTPENRRCELVLGSNVFSGLLVNESSRGCAVLVGGLPGVARKQKALLRDHRGWHECRVVYVKEIVPVNPFMDPSVQSEPSEPDDDAATITAADVADFTSNTPGPWFRLGVNRHRTIAPSTLSADSLIAQRRRGRPLRWFWKALSGIFTRR